MSDRADPASVVALKKIIKKSRVHLYKPIQIAEILYRHRTAGDLDLNDLESYRNSSKRWRDDISSRLVGRSCTSSQKFQDNLFENNAMPPTLLAELGELNLQSGGIVEAYTYKELENRMQNVRAIRSYISESQPDDFSLRTLISRIETNPGLRRSIDKIYEITVYALFSTIIREIRARVTVEIDVEGTDVLTDFQDFIKSILGVDAERPKLVFPAALYRAGVANAADRGVDMWSNFGPAIQVKHLTLTRDSAEDIVDGIRADKIVIVCLNSDVGPIESLLTQVGWGDRIQSIITIENLDQWYALCLRE